MTFEIDDAFLNPRELSDVQHLRRSALALIPADIFGQPARVTVDAVTFNPHGSAVLHVLDAYRIEVRLGDWAHHRIITPGALRDTYLGTDGIVRECLTHSLVAIARKIIQTTLTPIGAPA